MKDPICCPQCAGKGRVSLHSAFPHRAETLALLRENGPLTATEARLLCGKNILITGMNNRLEDLRELGFVKREKYGREWLYSVVPEE